MTPDSLTKKSCCLLTLRNWICPWVFLETQGMGHHLRTCSTFLAPLPAKVTLMTHPADLPQMTVRHQWPQPWTAGHSLSCCSMLTVSPASSRPPELPNPSCHLTSSTHRILAGIRGMERSVMLVTSESQYWEFIFRPHGNSYTWRTRLASLPSNSYQPMSPLIASVAVYLLALSATLPNCRWMKSKSWVRACQKRRMSLAYVKLGTPTPVHRPWIISYLEKEWNAALHIRPHT